MDEEELNFLRLHECRHIRTWNDETFCWHRHHNCGDVLEEAEDLHAEENEMPEAEYTVLTTNPSRSNPGTTHQVRRSLRDNVLYCTCPRWTLNQGLRGCSHLAKYRKAARNVATIGRKGSVNHLELRLRTMVEVDDHGDSVIVNVDVITNGTSDTWWIEGPEILDDQQWKISAEGRRKHRVKDITRILA